MARMVNFIMFLLYLSHFKIDFYVLAQCFPVFRVCSIHRSARRAGRSRCITLSLFISYLLEVL